GDDGSRDAPFDGDPKDPAGMALNRKKDGPWPVDQGDRDVSVWGVRQLASNGLEWTRDLTSNGVLPLKNNIGAPDVYVAGASYVYRKPLTFKDMQQKTTTLPPSTAGGDIGFRVVLEQ